MVNSGFITEEILHHGMSRQLLNQRTVLEAGHQRLGWKIGFNTSADQQRMGLLKPLVGFLTTDRQMLPGSPYHAKANHKLLIEAELAILIGKDLPASADIETIMASIEAVAPALEIVDVTDAPTDIADILSGNLFHDTVIIGEKYFSFDSLLPGDIQIHVDVNGDRLAESDPGRYPENFIDFPRVVAETLEQHDETLRAGDWIITGSLIKPFTMSPGQDIHMKMLPLGELSLSIV